MSLQFVLTPSSLLPTCVEAWHSWCAWSFLGGVYPPFVFPEFAVANRTYGEMNDRLNERTVQAVCKSTYTTQKGGNKARKDRCLRTNESLNAVHRVRKSRQNEMGHGIAHIVRY
ncbi:hypothetical protein BC826DRAFT_1013455, partial [Russula brevipes]